MEDIGAEVDAGVEVAQHREPKDSIDGDVLTQGEGQNDRGAILGEVRGVVSDDGG